MWASRTSFWTAVAVALLMVTQHAEAGPCSGDIAELKTTIQQPNERAPDEPGQGSDRPLPVNARLRKTNRQVAIQSNDALPIRGRHYFSGVCQTIRQPVDPQPAIRIEHHLNDRWIFQKARDCWAERRAEHTRPTRDRLRLKRMDCHCRPQRLRPSPSGLRWG